MSASGYTTLTRMSGLARDMRVVANNIANAQTTGYRAEKTLFTEFVRDLGETSLSMASARVGHTSLTQGILGRTGGKLDFAIEGDGFFQIGTPDGIRLTRAGAFVTSPEGDLVTSDGNPVLDAGGAPIQLPPGAEITVAADGTMTAGDRPIAELGLVRPEDPNTLIRQGSQLFDPGGPTAPVDGAQIRQGFLESSNVDPITELARMIEVSRAYELGQSFLDSENDRVKSAIEAMTR